MILQKEYGTVMNHKKIRRIKNEYGLITRIRRKNPYRAMAKKNQEHSICPNILNRRFNISIPYRAYSTDITYLSYGKKYNAFLSAIKDIATGEIIAHSISMHINIEFVIKMLDETILKTPNLCFKNLIIHSDQGFHYTHPMYREKLRGLNITQSMSRKGNCLDNAPIESFFGHLKDEVDYSNCATFEELEKRVNEYIHYYNYNRYQWSLNKMTPVQYRDHLLVA